ncbi:DNA-directed RNA polymerase II subunit GRINL1A [Aphidius gifuensis]|uniref:DNA-directed RNA polymerase II subunit GRINL1A n=1 Tax=Aphidius gifuensis TaxID=684658 RepID=UPI001CDB6598|nr:DNA-directed RNA polymerase II subunit GRINL1A [Aphidius gifuensis]
MPTRKLTEAVSHTSVMKKESQGYIDNLKNKNKTELQDLLERQNKLLANTFFIKKLPDKGERIKKFKDKLIEELSERNDIDNAANLLSRLNIAIEGKEKMNELEWTGTIDDNKNNNDIVIVESDDEDKDPIKIIAESAGAGFHEKKIIHLPPEERLITDTDLAEIESFKNERESVKNEEESSGHVKHILNKIEVAKVNCQGKKEPFKPYQTTKSNVHDPEKEKLRKKNKHWENTAATPPTTVHGRVKELSLNESLQLQIQQTEKLHQVQMKHSIERLMQQVGMHNVGLPPIEPGDYRFKKDDSDSSDGEYEDEEVYDDEDNDRAGTVSFPVDSIIE